VGKRDSEAAIVIKIPNKNLDSGQNKLSTGQA
jgi:hypothetical protein